MCYFAFSMWKKEFYSDNSAMTIMKRIIDMKKSGELDELVKELDSVN